MKKTFVILSLFIACIPMVHGMDKDLGIAKRKSNDIEELERLCRRKVSINCHNFIDGRLVFLKVKKFYNVINGQNISLQDLSDIEIEKYKTLCNNLKNIYENPHQIVIDDTEKEIVPYMLEDFKSIENTCELFNKLLSRKLSPKKISGYLPTKDNDPNRFKKLNNFCPWLIVDDYGNNAFLWGLGKFYLRVIKKILNHYPDLIFSKNKDGETALHIATRKNKPLLVKFLTDTNKICKIDVNAQENHFGKTALHIACSDLNVRIVCRLLQREAQIKLDNNGQTVINMLLDCPLTKKSIEMIRMILAKYPNAKVKNSESQFILKLIQSEPKDMSPEKLLGDINNILEKERKERQSKEQKDKIEKKERELEKTIKRLKLKKEEELKRAYEKEDQRLDNLSKRFDNEGIVCKSLFKTMTPGDLVMTSLKCATFNDEKELKLLKILLEAKVNLALVSSFFIPLCEMAKRGYLQSMKFLLENFEDIDVNQTNKFCDKTALRIAVLNNYMKIAQLLLEHGSSTSFCLDDAITITKNKSMMRLLLMYGATSKNISIYFDNKKIDLTDLNNQEVLRKVFTDVPENIDIIRELENGIHIIINRRHIFEYILVKENNTEKMDCFLKNHLEIIDTFNELIEDKIYPLDYAINFKNSEIVKLLLIYGIDTMSRDSESEPLRFRFKPGIHEEIIEKLRNGKLKITLKKVIHNGESRILVKVLPVESNV